MVQKGKNGRIIKCKYCDWWTRAIMRSKSGRIIRGWGKLAHHIYDQHPEHKDVADNLLADYGDDSPKEGTA